jgi:Domain of unknown function (DUF4340)
VRKNWISLGVMFALVIALGLFAGLKPPKAPANTVPVSAHKAATATSLKVVREGKTLAVLEKRGNAWHLNEPFKAPADDFQVARLLAVREAQASASYTPDLARYELAQPRAVLEIDGERYAFGAINNVTQEQYLLTGDTVYAVGLRYGAAIPNHAATLARRTVFAPGDKPVKFEFGVYTLAQDSMKWVITPAAELSQDMSNRWVAQWREGSALRVEPADERKPARELFITLIDGKRISMGVVQSEPELIVRRADLGLQWVYTGDIGRQMLMPPPLQ